MKRIKRKKSFDVDYEKREIPLSLVDVKSSITEYDKKELKTRAAYFLLNGIPVLRLICCFNFVMPKARFHEKETPGIFILLIRFLALLV